MSGAIPLSLWGPYKELNATDTDDIAMIYFKAYILIGITTFLQNLERPNTFLYRLEAQVKRENRSSTTSRVDLLAIYKRIRL